MYLERLHLQNIRCFEDLELDFNSRGGSALLTGNNNAGKTTVLRSLAMALCDRSSASALFRELPGEFARRGSDGIGRITVQLGGGGGYKYFVTTEIHSLDAFERVDQKVWRTRGRRRDRLDQDNFPWHRIFASGYGAGIRVNGTGDADFYLAGDALYPLFRYDAPLQNPELVIRRLLEKHRLRGRGGSRDDGLSELRRLLAELLQLRKRDRVELAAAGVQVRGKWGRTDLGSLGDGYRATLTWVLDLIGWYFVKCEQENARKQSPTDIHGIVLIDEIEQHLDSDWQRNIMGLITTSFPDVQFIATSHSPSVLAGCEAVQVHNWS